MEFMAYVTDSLYLSGQGKYIGHRWFDMIRPRVIGDVDPQEVVNDVVKRAGLVIA